MLAGKTLVDFTSLFSPYDFEKMIVWYWVILKMNETDNTNLTDQTKFILDEISKIENYLNQQIDQKKIMQQKIK